MTFIRMVCSIIYTGDKLPPWVDERLEELYNNNNMDTSSEESSDESVDGVILQKARQGYRRKQNPSTCIG